MEPTEMTPAELAAYERLKAIKETVQQTLWLKSFLEYLALGYQYRPETLTDSMFQEFVEKRIQHLSMFSWSALDISKAGRHDSRTVDPTEIMQSVVAYAVIYQTRGDCVKFQTHASTPHRVGEFPSPQAIMDTIAHNAQIKQWAVTWIAVVKFDYIIRGEKSDHPYILNVYPCPPGFVHTPMEQ